MNQLTVTLVGNLTEDPELRVTPAGVAICVANVAHNPRYFDKMKNEWTDQEPTFVRLVAWRELAEHMAETLQSGHRVIVIGDLQNRSWEADGRGKAPAGTKLYRLEMTVSAIGPELRWATAVVSKTKSDRSGGPSDDPWNTATRQRPAEPAGSFPTDDEPPF